MKKIASLVVLLTFFAALAVPFAVSAEQEKIPNCCKVSSDVELDSLPGGECVEDSYAGWEDTCNLSNAAPTCKTKNWGIVCLVSSITVITDWVFYVVLSLVIFFVLYGAWKLMSSGGESKKTEEGRKMIIYAAIGMVVALLAKAIPSLVRTIIGQ